MAPAPPTPFGICCIYVEIWRRGVELEGRRLARNAPNFRDRAGFVDAHLFAVALRNLLVAAEEARGMAPDRQTKQAIKAAIQRFEADVPGIRTLRNTIEHFKEHHLAAVKAHGRGGAGKGLVRRIEVFGRRRRPRRITIMTADVEIEVASARKAALQLVDRILKFKPTRVPVEVAKPITLIVGPPKS